MRFGRLAVSLVVLALASAPTAGAAEPALGQTVPMEVVPPDPFDAVYLLFH